MMKPLQVTAEDETSTVYACIHWRTFPVAFAGTPDTPEELRDRKVIDGAGYQRYKVWERECNLLRMAEDKCMTCPHIRKLEIVPHQVPRMVKLDGSGDWTPAVDIPAVASVGRYRRRDPKMVARESRQQTVNAEKAVVEAGVAKALADRDKKG